MNNNVKRNISEQIGEKTVFKKKRYQFIILKLFGVDALWVVDGSINFTNTHTLGPEPVQVPHGVETHITKALRKTKQKQNSSS